jgi:hypothetical protein
MTRLSRVGVGVPTDAVADGDIGDHLAINLSLSSLS